MKAIIAALLAAAILAAPLPLAFHSYAMAGPFDTGDSYGPYAPNEYTHVGNYEGDLTTEQEIALIAAANGDDTCHSCANAIAAQIKTAGFTYSHQEGGEAVFTRLSKPRVMLAQAKPSWSQEPWSYEAQSPKGFSDPRPNELNEQIAINNEHKHRTIEQLDEDGGCSAPVVPYGYAVECGGFLVNNAPFGGADNNQMGSSGGD